MLDLVNAETSRLVFSFPRRRPRKTWDKVIQSDQEEMKVGTDLVKDRNA